MPACMVIKVSNAFQLPQHVLSPRFKPRAVQLTALMCSAPRFQPHSWSENPADLSELAAEFIKACPIALTSSLKEYANAVQLIERGLAAGEGFSGGSEYTGLAGSAHAYLHLYESLAAISAGQPGQLPEPLQTLLASQERLLSKAAEMAEVARASPQRVTFLEGMPGVLCIRAAVYRAQGQDIRARETAKEVKLWESQAASLSPGEDELLYGQAGYLYCLLFLHKRVGPTAGDKSLVHRLMKQIVLEGKRHPLAAEYGGLMYSWHGSPYLGAAHGLAGILHTLALAHKKFPHHDLRMELDVDLGALIRSSTLALIDHTFPSGNLPSSHGSETDKLVHWCHGATGFLPLLLEVEGLCGGDEAQKVHAAAEQAAQVIWERGLLLKGPGLCHGVSGNGYALLSAYKHTKDARYLVRATGFAMWLTEHWQQLYGHADRPLSLYEGISGAVFFWADVLAVHMSRREQELERVYFPGYEI